MIELVKVGCNNMDYYKYFEQVFYKDLNQYQSRIYPKESSFSINWYYIKFGDEYIGSIWLEKDKSSTFAVLGVFIADRDYRDRGIGKQAIRKIIEDDAKNMNIKEIHLNVREENVRAISCYFSLGFKETGRYTKEDGINVVSMSFTL